MGVKKEWKGRKGREDDGQERKEGKERGRVEGWGLRRNGREEKEGRMMVKKERKGRKESMDEGQGGKEGDGWKDDGQRGKERKGGEE